MVWERRLPDPGLRPLCPHGLVRKLPTSTRQLPVASGGPSSAPRGPGPARCLGPSGFWIWPFPDGAAPRGLPAARGLGLALEAVGLTPPQDQPGVCFCSRSCEKRERCLSKAGPGSWESAVTGSVSVWDPSSPVPTGTAETSLPPVGAAQTRRASCGLMTARSDARGGRSRPTDFVWKTIQ